MAKKYIDAELLKDNLRAACLPVDDKGISGMLGDDKSIADYIDDEPPVDVAKVKHGAWKQENEIFKCSECEYAFENEGYIHFFNYCPNCGARMDGEEK
jgi:hypothetical protein